ncbi:MAG: ABC transporter substrate-binding protein [Acidimicrobiia bacterium]|nr:ABC transporter substrate-binding protein [Acidimicrobiia bacterium]
MTLTRVAAAVALAGLVLAQSGLQAAQITVLCSNGIKAVMEELVPEFERATKHDVNITYGLAAALKRQIDGGERFDLAILTPALIDDLIKTGQVAANTRAVIARAPIGFMVRAGAQKPDVRTTEAVRRTLTASQSIAYAREGSSGVYFAGLLDKLGMTEGLKPKLRPMGSGEETSAAVAKGEAQLGVLPISEILPVPGVELLGPFPKDVQGYAVMVAGVGSSAAQSAVARELIAFLMAPARNAVITKKGMER